MKAFLGCFLAPLAVFSSPTQIHLSLGGLDQAGNPNGMFVAWFTPDATSTSEVQYGIDASNLNATVQGKASSYLGGYGFHHVALATDLPAATALFYRCGDADAGWSEVHSFTTAPATDATVNVAVFGDLGYKDSTERPMIVAVDGLVKEWSAAFTRDTLASLTEKKQIDMVWHVGDIGYADDSFAHHPVHFTYEDDYSGFMDWMQNITAAVPYMVSPGNHESECHSPACLLELKKYGKPLSNFTAFNHRWHMPSAESGAHPGSNMWYSFNYGPVHYISLNTETDFPGAEESTTGDSHDKQLPAGGFGAEGEYLRWLESDLARAHANRANRPWVVAGGHRPIHEIVDTVGPLFMRYGVDVYFSGHAHSYVRDSNPAGANGTVSIVAGGAGCDEMSQGTGGYHSADGDYVTSNRYAAGVMTANPHVLSWRLLDSDTGAVLDSFSLAR